MSDFQFIDEDMYVEIEFKNKSRGGYYSIHKFHGFNTIKNTAIR